MAFQVELDLYSGPLELLLYLVRREELPLCSLSLGKMTEQYLNYIEMLGELDLDGVAEFLEVASMLIEMKAKQALPSTETAVVDDEKAIDDPADQLVTRLLEYKRIRDAASILEEQGRKWQLRYARLADDLPVRGHAPDEQPIQDLEVWDLVSAFGRILRERTPPPTENVVYDETPIHVHMERIHSIVNRQRRIELTSLFEPRMHKSTLVGLFLATLELTRHYGLSTEQSDACEPLYLVAGEGFSQEIDVHKIDNLSVEQISRSNLPVMPR